MLRCIKILAGITILFFIVLIFFSFYFSAPSHDSSKEIFIVPIKNDKFNYLKALNQQGYVKNKNAFTWLVGVFFKDIAPESGGYRVRKNMNAFQLLKVLSEKPELKWVSINYCQRKEEIGDNLAKILKWENNKLKAWNTYLYNNDPDYTEGVYYPDTYLIPIDESVEETAKRFIGRFNEKFNPLADKFLISNIKWTTALKIASLIERESGSLTDKNIISAVIWNRLEEGMPLQIDATMQYTRGKQTNGLWWGGVDLSEKQSSSPYNTYIYKGLPPTPICSPTIESIKAVLEPSSTDCLYYLHDKNGLIHCAEEYSEHLDNIEYYLK
jgi:UPF0755 protein